MTKDHFQSVQQFRHTNRDINMEKARRGTRLVLEAVGEKPERDELAETWERRVPEALTSQTAGERKSAKPTMWTFEAESNNLVIKTEIPIYSLCERHLLPFFGTAYLAYRPKNETIGCSKLFQYVRWRSHRLTIQERLTENIASGLAEELDISTVLVEVITIHLCEQMCGIEVKSKTITFKLSATQPIVNVSGSEQRLINRRRDR